MGPEQSHPIRTDRLELVPLTTRFLESAVAGDAATAGAAIGATVGARFVADANHLVQLHLAAEAAEVQGFPGFGRAIVLAAPGRDPRVIGSVGFHGPPDDRGRLEASCRIDPAHRSWGYAAEALAALLDWAAARHGVTRFLVAVPAGRELLRSVPVEIAMGRPEPLNIQLDEIAGLLDAGRRLCWARPSADASPRHPSRRARPDVRPRGA